MVIFFFEGFDNLLVIYVFNLVNYENGWCFFFIVGVFLCRLVVWGIN